MTKFLRFFSVVAVFLLLVQYAAAQDGRVKELLEFAQKIWTVLDDEPQDGVCHRFEFDGSKLSATLKERIGAFPVEQIKFLLVRGERGKFRLEISSELTGNAVFVQSDRPWIQTNNGTVFIGDKTTAEAGFDHPFPFVREDVQSRVDTIGGMAALFVGAGSLPVKIDEKDWDLINNVRSALRVELNIDEKSEFFAPNPQATLTIVSTEDLHRQFSAVANFASDRLLAQIPVFAATTPSKTDDSWTLLAKASNGKGLLAERFGHKVLFITGTPQEMGAAHGELLKDSVHRTMERLLYAVGTLMSIRSGQWFFDEFEEIERRTAPFIPQRFVDEADSLSQAVGMSIRDGRYGNLFPERFHCSGVAVRGKATKDGRLYHARVLDYMSDILLQEEACFQVFMPKDHLHWMSHSYGGFVGTVTAMNEKGLAMGEMGGRGEGQWDGLTMSYLMREIMENASNIDEALAIIHNTRLTCEYYYVLSEASKNMVALKCTPEEVLVLKPGEQHELLPPIPEDSVYVSAGNRAVELGRRLHEHYGKIDAELLIEIVKRPVAMNSNLHNAIFVPESLEMFVADAGTGLKVTPACDMPYKRFQWNELLRFYEENAR